MSDYIAELRRELVDAAERERRRRAPRRALARARRTFVPVLAGVAVVALAGLIIAVLGREQPAPSPAQPRIVDTIRIGGVPRDATVGAGSVWVTDADGLLRRVDPRTGRVIATVRAGTRATSVTASADAVWLMAAIDRDGHQVRLTRIDPASSRVVARIGRFSWDGAILAAAPDAVWLQRVQLAPVPLRRVDPATNRIEVAFGRDLRTAMAADEDRLWTLSMDGVLEWRDSATGRLLGRKTGFPPRPSGGPWKQAIAADSGGAWIANGQDGVITRVATDGDVEVRADIGANGPLVLARGSLWVTLNDGTDRDARIARVDPATGRVTGSIPVGARLPMQLLAVGDDLWAVLSDGTAIVVR
jgi:DNA-binding beta-propeller fold protein YncE